MRRLRSALAGSVVAILAACGARTTLDLPEAGGGTSVSSSVTSGGTGGGVGGAGGGGGAGGALWFVPFEPDLAIDAMMLGADAAGDAYVAASLELEPGQSLDFGGPIPCADAGDEMRVGTALAKFDPTGQRVWARCFTSDGPPPAGVSVNGLAVGPAGEVAFVGTFEGTVDLGGGLTITSTIGAEILAVFDASGAPRYTVQAEGNDVSWGAAIDGAGRVVLAGTVTPSLPFPVDPLVGGLFVASLEADGALAWSTAYGGQIPDYNPASVAVAADGRVAIGESMSTGIEGWPAMPGPTASPYVVVTDAFGDILWTAAGRGLPDPNSPLPEFGGAASSVAFAGGRVVAGGIQYAPVDFGFGTFGKPENLFGVEFDEPGSLFWQKSVPSIGGGLLAGDGENRLVMAENAENADGLPGASCTTGWCLVLATFDANGVATGGHVVSAVGLPDTGSPALVSGAAFGPNMLLVTGYVSASSLDFGAGPIAVDQASGFLAALPE